MGFSAILVNVPEQFCLFVYGFCFYRHRQAYSKICVGRHGSYNIGETLLRKKGAVGPHTPSHSYQDQYGVGLVKGWTHGSVGRRLNPETGPHKDAHVAFDKTAKAALRCKEG